MVSGAVTNTRTHKTHAHTHTYTHAHTHAHTHTHTHTHNKTGSSKTVVAFVKRDENTNKLVTARAGGKTRSVQTDVVPGGFCVPGQK